MDATDENVEDTSLDTLINIFIFRRIPHHRAALDYLEQVLAKRRNRSARRLIRLLIILLHNGLLKMRIVTLDAMRRLSKHCTSSAGFPRTLALFLALEHGEARLYDWAMRRAATDGDPLSNYFMGAGGLGQGLSEESFGFLVRAVSMGETRSMFVLGGQFVTAGFEVLGLRLLLLGANLGNCGCFHWLLQLAMAFHDGNPPTRSPGFIDFVDRAHSLFYAFKDSEAGRFLFLLYDGAYGYPKDSVFWARLYRDPTMCGNGALLPSLLLFGENIWRHSSTGLSRQSISGRMLNVRKQTKRFDLSLVDFGFPPSIRDYRVG